MQSETEERERLKKEMRLSLYEESTTFREICRMVVNPSLPPPPAEADLGVGSR